MSIRYYVPLFIHFFEKCNCVMGFAHVMETSQSVRRTTEIEELTNLYVIHPIANRLTLFFAWLGISPNTVSITGMACGLGASFAYYHYHVMICAIIGFVLMIFWH